MDWLSHSRKKYCELCNYHYKFTPIYKKDMPTTIPKRIFLCHLKNMLCLVFRWTLRACLVSFIWLGVVPFLTIWIWRFYFWNADTTNHLFSKYFLVAHNSNSETTAVDADQHNSIWRTVLYDCLQGWLIASIITVVFIAGFLLREWVIQNVPTELFDQEEEEEEEEEGEDVQHGHEEIPALIPEAVPVREQEQEQEQIPRIRRGRINNPRRPPLREEPSDYENLEAMWLIDEAQVLSPSYVRERDERDPFDLDLEDDDAFDDGGYFNESEEEEGSANSERIREIVDAIQREQQNQPNRPNPVDLNAHDIDQEVIVPQNEENENENMDNAANGGPDGPEEIDGIMEAIGMKGSIYMMFQNSGLMTLLMSLCLGAGVWLPYVLGVFFITVHPWNGVFLLLDGLRYLLDPVLDFISDQWLDFYSQLDPVSHWIPTWTPTFLKSIILTAVQIGQHLIRFFSIGTDQETYLADNTMPMSTANTTSALTLSQDILMDPTTVQSYSVSLWHDLIKFWSYAKPFCQSFLNSFSQMPTGDTAMDRFGCIVTGYVILVVIGSLYLSRTDNVYVRIGRTARQIIRQLGILLKVAFFVTIEVTVFPLGCGLLLDCVALSLFYKIGGGGGAAGHLLAIHRRMTFLKENATSSIFIHWVIGTGFMFLFTAMVTFCRNIVRPGVIWFIRDPNDPQFNPIKELVKRPLLSQLQKIGASAMIYGFVIEVGVGGLVAVIGAVFDGILPLKWSYTKPLTTIPIDLLVAMMVVPSMVQYFDPKQLLEKITIRWTTWLCHQLRLTSFLLGGRPISEEGYIRYKTWRAWIQRPPSNDATFHQDSDNNKEEEQAEFVTNGLLVRAPKHDGVRYVPGRRVLVPVDPITLEALDPHERSLGHPAAANLDQDGQEEEDTTIVYLPPQFKLRMAIFMAIMWGSWSALLCYVFVGPVAVGRWLFQYYGIVAEPGQKIHDIYAYFIGGCVMIFVAIFVKKTKTIIALPAFDLSKVLYAMNWAVNFITIVISFGLIIPLILGAILQLYLIIPCQNWGSRAPVIDVFSVYTNGLVCLTLVDGIASALPNQTLLQSLIRLKGNGISGFDCTKEIKGLIGPVVLNGLLAILLPFSLVVVRHFFDVDTANEVEFLQILYPSVFIGLALYYSGSAFTKFGRRWSQSIREDHYLVGRVLHNMDTAPLM
ncbi:hypothetical protein BD408DRAFT_444988 [Parasitella parasitica]|nr:hypothetical protein BD408DRAFT_444988 [Parasitella parasitica]